MREQIDEGVEYVEDEWERLQDDYNREQWEQEGKQEFADPPPSGAGLKLTRINLQT